METMWEGIRHFMIELTETALLAIALYHLIKGQFRK